MRNLFNTRNQGNNMRYLKNIVKWMWNNAREKQSINGWGKWITNNGRQDIHVRYHFGGSMELNACILLLALMVYL
jgi:hypothetical protein